ncbi:hypothetical protein AURDEDRAFT_156481 [Auricularia subglabra TFB-10046 SS5]|nr:hypothetical protein AURDEDRAFT_156481 [Auricularia subglabra TFB-10046 SS5]
MSSPRKSSDNILQYAASRPTRPSLDIPYTPQTPNYSRPLFAQSSVSFPSPSYEGQQRVQRRMHSIDAMSTFSGKRGAAAQHHVYGAEASNISTLLDSFPAVPATTPPPYDTFPRARGRSVSLGGNALKAAYGTGADHKKSFSDPMPTTQPKLSPKKSFKQSLRSIFHRETRKSNAGSPSTSAPSSAAPLTPTDETVRLRTWTLSRSPRKAKKSLSGARPFDVEPPSPADSGALADHEHLSPITWGAGKTVNVSADGLTRKASVLRLNTDTLVLRMHPSPSMLSVRRQPAFQMIDGKPACRLCGELFYLEHSPSCGCGADSDEENDYGEVINSTSEDGGEDFPNADRLPAYAH